MAERPKQEEIDHWHRWFAIECNNQTWDLASKADRTPAEGREMLLLAYSAAYHWLKIGKPINDARADLTLAHALSLLGYGGLALESAKRCLDYVDNNPSEDWDRAFAHAEMAYAAAVAGNADLHARHYARAQEQGMAIKDDADRKIFMDELSRIPSEVRPRQMS